MRIAILVTAGLGLSLVFSGASDRGSSRPAVARRLDQFVRDAGWSGLGAEGLVLAAGCCAVVGGVTLLAMTGDLMIAAGAACAALLVPFSVARARREVRQRASREAWPDALMHLISGVRSGVSLAESCMALAERGPDRLRGAFWAFSRTYRASSSFDVALDRLRDELEDPTADRVVAVLRMAHEVGGNDLVRVLRATADMIREDLRIRGEVHARWSWTITAARVAAGAPFVVLLLMSLRPEAAAAYRSSEGVGTILIGTAVTVCGYRLMKRAARLPEEARWNR